MDKFKIANKQLWNNWTKIHSTSSFYDLAKFKEGKTSLRKVELQELTDVKNKSMLHLQCHFGLDSISWARKGAKVTAVDFSDASIELARSLSKEVDVPVDFICSDVYELPKILNKKFDIVYTTYGVLGWLPDLNKWAEIVAHYLKPGGIFYMVEFHPFLNMLDKDWKTVENPYFRNREPIYREWRGTYAEKEADISNPAYVWSYTFNEIFTALRQANLIIDFLHEFPYSVYDCFSIPLYENKSGEYILKGRENTLPLMFSCKAILHKI